MIIYLNIDVVLFGSCSHVIMIRKWIQEQSEGQGCRIGIGWGIEWVLLKTWMIPQFVCDTNNKYLWWVFIWLRKNMVYRKINGCAIEISHLTFTALKLMANSSEKNIRVIFLKKENTVAKWRWQNWQ